MGGNTAPAVAAADSAPVADAVPVVRAASAPVVSYSFDRRDRTSKGRIVRGKHGRALRFRGRGDALVIKRRALGHVRDALTISAWVKPGAGDAAIISTSGGKTAWRLATRGSRLRLATTSGVTLAPRSARLQPGKWTHVALVADGSTLRLYLDGRLVGTRKSGLKLGNSGLRIGGFRGRLDDLRVYDRALTAAEVRQDSTVGA